MPNPQKRSNRRKRKQQALRNQAVATSTPTRRRRDKKRRTNNSGLSLAHFPKLNSHSLDYIKSLRNPWSFRQVRIPSLYSIATQAMTCHGNITFSANAGGFARFTFLPFLGLYNLFNDATHNETTLGNQIQVALPGAPSFTDGSSRFRLVSAGIIIRSTSSFSTEAGLMQTYVSYLAPTYSQYDVYRDSPFVFPYSKGQTAEVVYLPFMPACFDLLSSTQRSAYFEHYHMGVMITGAPNVVYSIQYAMNYEMIQGTNTDLVPLKTAPQGDHNALSQIVSHNSPVAKEWTLKSHVTDKLYNFAEGVARLGASLISSGDSNGFFRNTVKPLSGNEAILFAV